jgi:hypothetical protein
VTRSFRTSAVLRVRGWVRRALLLVFGRSIVCAECGRRLCVAIPVVWRGELRLIGADDALVRIAFRWTETLEFRHVELDRCPAPQRPWVRR